MEKKLISRVIAFAMAAMMMLAAFGCQQAAPVASEPTTAPVADATQAPAETAAPEPAAPAAPAEILPDVPADRYDATVTPRTGANENTPLVISADTMDGVFSPFFSTIVPDTQVYEKTQLNLVTIDKNYNLVAGINEACLAYDFTQEPTADGSQTHYTFTLKNGITFSDGTPVTMEDVLFNYYVYLDPMYDGNASIYTLDIPGLLEYRMQTSSEQVEIAKAIYAAGITQDASGAMVLPEVAGATPEQVQAFWAHLEEAGVSMVGDIAKYVIAKYGTDEKVAEKFPAGYTWEQVSASESFMTMYTMSRWGFGKFDGEKFIDAAGTEYDVATAELTYADMFALILANYGYDITDGGINAEIAPDCPRIEDYTRDLYLANEGAAEGGVTSVSGITNDKVICDDGVERDRLNVTVNGVDPTAVIKLGVLPIAPKAYYTEGFTGTLDEHGVCMNSKEFMDHMKTKSGKPMGAGPYIFIEHKDNIVTFEANDNFLMGSPKIKTLRMQELALGAQMDAVLTGMVHLSDPSASPERVNLVSEGEGDYGKLATLLVDTLGYGYIGINGQAYPEWEVRKALAHALNVELTITEHYGELATVNYRVMSKVKWAYPENPECLYPFDETGETSKQLFLEAGYIYDEAANVMYYPEGHEKVGQPFTVTAIIPSDAADHPAGNVFIEAQSVLAKIGIKMDIEVDQNILGKLPTAYESGVYFWTAAMSGGSSDPDMFQLWYSDPALNQGTSPATRGTYWLFANGSDDQKAALNRLNELILAGRGTLDVEERKVIYEEALEIATSLAVEIPTYQRKDMYVFNKEVINADTLLSGSELTPYHEPMFYIWNVELNG